METCGRRREPGLPIELDSSPARGSRWRSSSRRPRARRGLRGHCCGGQARSRRAIGRGVGREGPGQKYSPSMDCKPMFRADVAARTRHSCTLVHLTRPSGRGLLPRGTSATRRRASTRCSGSRRRPLAGVGGEDRITRSRAEARNAGSRFLLASTRLSRAAPGQAVERIMSPTARGSPTGVTGRGQARTAAARACRRDDHAA